MMLIRDDQTRALYQAAFRRHVRLLAATLNQEFPDRNVRFRDGTGTTRCG